MKNTKAGKAITSWSWRWADRREERRKGRREEGGEGGRDSTGRQDTTTGHFEAWWWLDPPGRRRARDEGRSGGVHGTASYKNSKGTLRLGGRFFSGCENSGGLAGA